MSSQDPELDSLVVDMSVMQTLAPRHDDGGLMGNVHHKSQENRLLYGQERMMVGTGAEAYLEKWT
jgi:hypothetical protein